MNDGASVAPRAASPAKTGQILWLTVSAALLLIAVAVTALMFLSPLFYPSSALPENLRWLSAVNPIAFSIEQTRDVLVFGNMPRWRPLALYAAISALIMWAGFAWFQKTRRGFADVL